MAKSVELEVLEAVDCLNGLVLLCKSLAFELNILCKKKKTPKKPKNIKMCPFT